MAIIIYNDGDHPAGFIGIRVAVLGITKEYKQEYFAFRSGKDTWITKEQEDAYMLEAQALERQWMAEEHYERIMSVPHIGVSMGYEYKRGKWYPLIRCQAQANKEGKRVCVAKVITIDRKLHATWEDASKLMVEKMYWPEEKEQQMLQHVSSIKLWKLNAKRIELNKHRKPGQPYIRKQWLDERYGL